MTRTATANTTASTTASTATRTDVSGKGSAVVLREGERWVTCTRDTNWSVARERHVLTRNGIDTACGSTGLGEGVWRTNNRKPPCATCIARRTPTPAAPAPVRAARSARPTRARPQTPTSAPVSGAPAAIPAGLDEPTNAAVRITDRNGTQWARFGDTWHSTTGSRRTFKRLAATLGPLTITEG